MKELSLVNILRYLSLSLVLSIRHLKYQAYTWVILKLCPWSVCSSFLDNALLIRNWRVQLILTWVVSGYLQMLLSRSHNERAGVNYIGIMFNFLIDSQFYVAMINMLYVYILVDWLTLFDLRLIIPIRSFSKSSRLL